MFYCCLKRSSVHHHYPDSGGRETTPFKLLRRWAVEPASNPIAVRTRMYIGPRSLLGAHPSGRCAWVYVTDTPRTYIEGPKGGAGFVALGLSHLLA
jgi:hypothetical protein